MKIRIGFSRRKMFFSRFLQWAEKRPYSHCYIRYRHYVTGQDLIFHAAGLTVNTAVLSNFQDKHKNIIVKEYEFEIKDINKIKALLTFMLAMSGAPYGWIQLIGMGIVKAASFLGIKMKNPLGDNNKTMVCSEFVAHAMTILEISDIDLAQAEIEGPSWVDEHLKEYSPIPPEDH